MEEKLDTIIELLSKMQLLQSQNTFRLWSLDEELLLRDLYKEGVSDLDIAVALREQLNSERSSSSVRKRALEMKITNLRAKTMRDTTPILDGIYDDPPF